MDSAVSVTSVFRFLAAFIAAARLLFAPSTDTESMRLGARRKTSLAASAPDNHKRFKHQVPCSDVMLVLAACGAGPCLAIHKTTFGG